MDDIFKPISLTVKKMFGDADALYQIPRYQRPYSWGDEQLEKLWEDLVEAQEFEANYFLGSIITAKPSDASNYLDVVDGQQRLTTILILLCVCRDLYPDLNEQILEIDPTAIDVNIIKTSIKYNDRFERLRLKTHSNHASDFQDLILKEGAASKNTRPFKKDLRREEDPKYKFINTAAFFNAKLMELGEEGSGMLINYLFNNVSLIRIHCQSVSFAIKLFQVLNDRGLDLSNSDLIKSFLVGQIHKEYLLDEELKKQKEDQFMDDWKYCENVAIDTDESLNDLFVLYEYYLLGANPKKSLYDELQKEFEGKDPNEAISGFKRFVTLFKNQVYYREDSKMYGFWYLRWSMYWRSIVVTALMVGYKDYEQFVTLLKRYYYINWIAGNTLTKIKQTSFNLIGWLKDGESISFIKQKLNEGLTADTVDRAVNNLGGDIYYEAWCKPLFFMIEYQQQDNSNYLDISNKSIHIEHVLPTAYAKNPDWRFYHTFNRANSILNTAANLTLLSGTKNIAASNHSFDKKIIAYTGTGHHDVADKKITSFVITRKIVDDYSDNLYQKQWTPDAMGARWIWFCDNVEAILDIDLSRIRGLPTH
jgi:uncharacterized protein with ParB-like and HNH nuclease domain